MDELLEGWKAINTNDRSSAIQFLWTGAVKYYKDIWIVPRENCGPLTVFKTEEAAEFFVHALSSSVTKVVRCIYKPSYLRTVWYGLQGSEVAVDILEEVNKRTILPGSVALADAILPLE